MGQKIFQLLNGGQLVEQNETAYEQETHLQELLMNNPDLMDGALIDEDNPRRWLLVKREASVLINDETGNYGSLDHLFLDQDGIPTLVEVKRSSDTRIRREVVGQMMDYAVNARNTWQNGRIRQFFESTCEENAEDADDILGAFLEDTKDIEEFWQDVETNLRAGKIRLLFVADKIPKELKAIIEFLNEQFASIEVLGFEIPQFKGGDTITLVPKLIGQTATSRAVKQTGSARKKWNEQTCFEQFRSDSGEEGERIARRIFDWAKKLRLQIRYGTGGTYASFAPFLEMTGRKITVFAVYSNGYFEVYFQYLKRHKPFDESEKRLELLHKLNRISGISIPESKLDYRPNLSFDFFQTEADLNELLKVHEWVVAELRNASQEAG